METMRTIKFRAKATHTNKWLYGDLINIRGKYHLLEKDDMREDGHHITQDSDIPTWVDETTIGQFTGVLDKNGKEIYEGDIVKVRVTNDRFKKNPRFRNGVVAFCEYDGGWAVGCYYRFLPKRMEVIGNIHDNPELKEEDS